MIFDEDFNVRMLVSRAKFEAEREALAHDLMDALQAEMVYRGGRVGTNHMVTFIAVDPGQDPDTIDPVPFFARLTGMDQADVIGGFHDGLTRTIDPHAGSILIPESGEFGAVGHRYLRAGVNDETGHWAFVPEAAR